MFGHDHEHRNAVDFGERLAANVKFDHRIVLDKLCDILRSVIDEELTLVTRHHLSVDHSRHPGRHARVDDAVGDQLCGQIEVIAAGRERRPQQRQVAIRGRRI